MSVDEKSKVYLIGGPGNPNLLTKKQNDVLRKLKLFYMIV